MLLFQALIAWMRPLLQAAFRLVVPVDLGLSLSLLIIIFQVLMAAYLFRRLSRLANHGRGRQDWHRVDPARDRREESPN